MALALCAVFVALRFELSTDITRFAIDPGHADPQHQAYIDFLQGSTALSPRQCVRLNMGLEA